MNYNFRGLTLDDKVMFGNYIHPHNNAHSTWIGIGDPHDISWYQIKPDSLEEFTGYYDIENNPIYENDTVIVYDVDCGGSTSSTVKKDTNTGKFIVVNPDYTMNFYPNINLKLI